MLDSWNIVSKAWWISAKDGRSEGFHCQPGQTRPKSDHPRGLADSVGLAILTEKSRNKRSIPTPATHLLLWQVKMIMSLCLITNIKNLKKTLDISSNMDCETPERRWQPDYIYKYISQPDSSKYIKLLHQIAPPPLPLLCGYQSPKSSSVRKC